MLFFGVVRMFPRKEVEFESGDMDDFHNKSNEMEDFRRGSESFWIFFINTQNDEGFLYSSSVELKEMSTYKTDLNHRLLHLNLI